MSTKEIIRSQYQAALEMLKQAITQCPQDLWADSQSRNQFWQIAYHALFYTHLYLQPTEQDFSPWELHYDGAHRFTPVRSGEGEVGRVMKKEELLDYLEYCQQEIDEKVAGLDLEADSGFGWIPFNKHELQYYNIRHLQHHAGELSERLGTRTGIDIHWVGMMPSDQPESSSPESICLNRDIQRDKGTFIKWDQIQSILLYGFSLRSPPYSPWDTGAGLNMKVSRASCGASGW